MLELCNGLKSNLFFQESSRRPAGNAGYAPPEYGTLTLEWSGSALSWMLQGSPALCENSQHRRSS